MKDLKENNVGQSERIDSVLSFNKDELIEFLSYRGVIKKQYGILIAPKGNTYHGTCCACSECKNRHDDCICGHNEAVEQLNKIILPK